jgi:hypothetical protein
MLFHRARQTLELTSPHRLDLKLARTTNHGRRRHYEAVGGRKLEGLASAMKQHQHTIRRHKSEREEVYRCTVPPSFSIRRYWLHPVLLTLALTQ